MLRVFQSTSGQCWNISDDAVRLNQKPMGISNYLILIFNIYLIYNKLFRRWKRWRIPNLFERPSDMSDF